MKTRNALWIAFCLAAGCGEAPLDEDEVRSQLLVGPVSEEQPQGTICPSGAVAGARCEGGYCDNITLLCIGVFAHIEDWVDTVSDPASTWSAWISEETAPKTPYQHNGHTVVGNTIGCENTTCGPFPYRKVMDGIRASGSNADDISIHCSTLQGNHTINGGACVWTPYFSEESACTPMDAPGDCSFVDVGNSSADRYAVAVRCRGSKCDDMSYLVCPLL